MQGEYDHGTGVMHIQAKECQGIPRIDGKYQKLEAVRKDSPLELSA